MTRCKADPADADDPAPDAPAHGIVLRLRLVAPGPGRASGTFDAVGAVSGGGTAVTDSFVPSPPLGVAAPVLVDGAIRMNATGGELVATIATVVRPVPGTGVCSGGGTWTLTRAAGAFDGLRAAGTMTLVVTYDDAGTATLDLVLTGRVVDADGAGAPSSRRG